MRDAWCVMADLLTLNCPTCGGNLQVTNAVERFVCAHCGNAHIVDPGVRVESLVEELRDESRLRRLAQEISTLEGQRNSTQAEIGQIKSDAASTGCVYQMGIAAAFGTAVLLTIYAVFELTMKHGSVAALLAVTAAFMAELGIIATKVYGSVTTVPNHDAQARALIAVERQIAQKQRELEALQQRVGLAPEKNGVASNNTQHTLRTTTS